MDTVLIAVISLDGCLTRHDDPGATGWASPADQAHFRAALAASDVFIMGSATYRDARDSIRANLKAEHRRIILSRSPAKFADDAVPGKLEFTSEDPRDLIARMRADGHRRCAVLGGGEVYNLFLGSGVVDELQLTLEPRVFGVGTRLAGTATPIDPTLSLVKVDHLSDDTLLLTYRRGTPT
jgi:dihydrofolate reductase